MILELWLKTMIQLLQQARLTYLPLQCQPKAHITVKIKRKEKNKIFIQYRHIMGKKGILT